MDRGLYAVGPVQVPRVILLGSPDGQAGPVRKFGGGRRHAMGLGKRGAGNKALAALGQYADDQVAVLERRRAHADG